MNKYIEMLDKFVAEINDEDCHVESGVEEVYLVRTVESAFGHSGMIDPESFFKDIIPNLNWIECIGIDCDTNEINFMTYYDEGTKWRDPELYGMDIRWIILDSLTADELEIYHEKCKAAIERVKKGFLNRVERSNVEPSIKHTDLTEKHGGDKMKTTIYVACKDGAVYNVPCKEEENGQLIIVSNKDIPINAYACFNDGLQACMVQETGRDLEVFPEEAEHSGSWYYPKMSRELTASMWFEPMQNFAQLVCNAAEILPVIEAEKCVEFGTLEGKKLLIYEIDPADNRKRIKYICSITHIDGKFVLKNVYSADGKLYECDVDKIRDEIFIRSMTNFQRRKSYET